MGDTASHASRGFESCPRGLSARIKTISPRESGDIEPTTEAVWESKLDRLKKITIHVERASGKLE